MAKLPTNTLHFPGTSEDGPYGVGSTDRSWYVVNKHTGEAKRIGPIQLTGVNYFDKAMEEADRRNKMRIKK